MNRVHISVLIGAALVLALTGAVVASSRPAVCGSCHAMAPATEGHAASPHAGVGCYDCHAPDVPAAVGFKLLEITRMYPRASSVPTLTGPAPAVPKAGCLRCHSTVMEGVVLARGIRIDHVACAQGPSCATCHAPTAHGAGVRAHKGPWMDECVRCHLSEQAPIECDTCHEGKRESDALQRGPWQVTHGADWRTTHGMGDLSLCATCHDERRCTGCHGVPMPHSEAFAAQHGRVIEDVGREDCYVCHDAKTFCEACHTVPMPHPEDYVKVHSTIASSMQDEACVVCHEQASCDWCHVRHVHPGGAKLPQPSGGRP